MKKLYYIAALLLLCTVVYAQPPIPPNAGAYNLASGIPYVFNSWLANSTVGTYPNNATLLTTFRTSPNQWATKFNAPNGRLGIWLCPYNLSSRSRFVGLGNRGIQFVLDNAGQNLLCNSILPTDTVDSRPFGFNLGLNTKNISEAVVSYTVQVTQLGSGATPRQARLALCYRTSLTDTFRLLPGAPIFATEGRAAGDSVVNTVNIPNSLFGIDLLQLAWIYYQPEIAGATGSARPQIRLDNISVTGTPLSASKKAAFQFGIAPNPSQGKIRVTDSYNGEKHITVYNLLGAKVAEVSSETTVTELNIQTKGMYMLEVKHFATAESATKKLIVE